MSRQTPTRIELHRLKFHWNKGLGPLIPFDVLSPDEKRILAEEILTKIHLNKGRSPYEVYAEILSLWGVACCHPQHMRKYSGTKESQFPLLDHRWYNCQVCKCSVMNEDFEPKKKTG